DLNDGSAKWATTREHNAAVLALPIYRDLPFDPATDNTITARIRAKLVVHQIDCSGPGREIVDCNAGRARQRGLLEAVLRFALRGHNGLIFHTDADCWYEDPEFVGKVRWLFNDPTLLAFAGAYYPELDLDDPEAEGIEEIIETYKLYRRYDRLKRDITRGYADMNFNDKIMLGSCSVHRAFEAVLVGGIPDIDLCEDVEFGNRLKEYATENGMRLEHGRRWGLGVVTAFRVSDRTGACIEHRFAKLSRNGPTMVDDVFNAGQQVPLTPEYVQRMVDIVREMPNGQSRIEYLFLMSPICHFRTRRN
ncbi:MAG TPA: hypothetical protein VGP24_17120, partial [Glaciihabitans sp.]|nr:hypothetical protein [Glaciihabitans sp.]